MYLSFGEKKAKLILRYGGRYSNRSSQILSTKGKLHREASKGDENSLCVCNWVSSVQPKF